MTELRQLCSPFSPFHTGMIMVATGIGIVSAAGTLSRHKKVEFVVDIA